MLLRHYSSSRQSRHFDRGYEHSTSKFRVPTWHILAGGPPTGLGLSLWVLHKPSNTDRFFFRPGVGPPRDDRRSSRDEVPSPSVDVWFAHEIDPVRPRPRTQCAALLGGLLQDVVPCPARRGGRPAVIIASEAPRPNTYVDAVTAVHPALKNRAIGCTSSRASCPYF